MGFEPMFNRWIIYYQVAYCHFYVKAKAKALDPNAYAKISRI